MPSNISPETALEITPETLPLVILGVNEAGSGATNIPPCVAVARNALWFKYTPSDWLNYFLFAAYNFETSASNYRPYTSIWTGTPSSLTLLTITDGAGSNQTYCNNLSSPDNSPEWIGVPILVPGTDYYIQVCNGLTTDAPVGSKLKLQLSIQKNFAAPVGSIIIPDDTDGFPAVILSRVSGAILQQRTFPAGETARVLPNGNIITQNGSSALSVALLDSQFAPVSTYTLPADYEVSIIWIDTSGYYYIYLTGINGNAGVYKVSKLDPVTQTVVHTTTLDKAYLNGAISPTGAFFYGAFNDGTNKIDKWTLATDTKTTTWSNVLHWYSTDNGFCNTDGKIVLPVSPDGIEQRVGRFSPATGALVDSFSFQGVADVTLTFDKVAYVDETQCMVWAKTPTGTDAYFIAIRYSDGALIVTGPVTFSSSSRGTKESEGWISNSCPAFLNTLAIEPITPSPPPFPGPIPASGADPAIYKLVKDKRNDTYYNDVDNETTVDIRIPDPYVITALIGDE